MPYKITNKEEFEKAIENKKVLIDFYADWCGPCRMLAPVLEEVEPLYKEEVSFLKVNVDDNPEIAEIFKVRSIPTLVLMNNKEVLKQEAGYKSQVELQAWIND